MPEATARVLPLRNGATTERPEIYHDDVEGGELTIIEQPLSTFETFYREPWLRKLFILVVLACIWEIYGRVLNNDLLFPTFTATAGAFFGALMNGTLPSAAWVSLKVLVTGYVIGIALAAALTALAMASRIGTDFLETMTSMFNPLPAIALLPLALLWFGLGQASLIFVLIHSVLWPMALNIFSGFQGVPETLRMAGRNYGLTGWRFVAQILVPAALPSIVSGLKIGWAFAWRTLIAAELVFGASSGRGGLG